MIVLHILWTILKIAGIILLILLGLLLLVVLAVLFCPVVYQAEGRKDADSLCGRAGVSWLCHLISFKIWYENEEMDYSVRVFGISLKKVLEFIEKQQEKKAKRKKIKQRNQKKRQNLPRQKQNRKFLRQMLFWKKVSL